MDERSLELSLWTKDGYQPVAYLDSPNGTDARITAIPSVEFHTVIDAADFLRKSIPENYLSIDEIIKEFQTAGFNDDIRQAREDFAHKKEAEFGKPSLKSLRLKKNMSQADLAKIIGTSQPHVARIESGDGNPNLDTLKRIAAALNIELCELATVL